MVQILTTAYFSTLEFSTEMFTELAIIDKITRNTSQNCHKFLLKSPICISKFAFSVSHMASKAMPKIAKYGKANWAKPISRTKKNL